MFKLLIPAIMCIALCCTTSSAQDCCNLAPACGCAPAPVRKTTRKKLALVNVTKEVCRTKVVCGTDACGCPTKQRVKVKECVTRKRLALVDTPIDPCKTSCISKLRGRLGAMKAKMCCNRPDPCCPAPAPAPCCEPAPAPCCN